MCQNKLNAIKITKLYVNFEKLVLRPQETSLENYILQQNLRFLFNDTLKSKIGLMVETLLNFFDKIGSKTNVLRYCINYQFLPIRGTTRCFFYFFFLGPPLEALGPILSKKNLINFQSCGRLQILKCCWAELAKT